jgi:hypothetical protein
VIDLNDFANLLEENAEPYESINRVKGLLATERDILDSLRAGHGFPLSTDWHFSQVVVALERHLFNTDVTEAYVGADSHDIGFYDADKHDSLRCTLFNAKVLHARALITRGGGVSKWARRLACAPLRPPRSMVLRRESTTGKNITAVHPGESPSAEGDVEIEPFQ